jgi:hypothetical protein
LNDDIRVIGPVLQEISKWLTNINHLIVLQELLAHKPHLVVGGKHMDDSNDVTVPDNFKVVGGNLFFE